MLDNATLMQQIPTTLHGPMFHVAGHITSLQILDNASLGFLFVHWSLFTRSLSSMFVSTAQYSCLTCVPLPQLFVHVSHGVICHLILKIIEMMSNLSKLLEIKWLSYCIYITTKCLIIGTLNRL